MDKALVALLSVFCQPCPPVQKLRSRVPLGTPSWTTIARAAVILAGGIGITPFRSMVFHAAEEKLPHRIFLFYANQRPEDAAFLEELQALEKRNQNYRFIPTMTGMEKSHRAWNGETGSLNKQMLSRHSNDAQSPIYYIAGFTPC